MDRRIQPIHVAADFGLQERVDGSGREALEFPELGMHFAGQRYEEVRQLRTNGRPDTSLVLGIEEGEQQADRHGFDIVHPGNVCDYRLDRLVRQFDDDFTLGVDPFGYLEPVLAIDQWHGRVGLKIVNRRPDLTAYLQKITEAFGRDEGRSRASALQKSIGRDRRAMREALDGFPWNAGLFLQLAQSVEDGLGRIVGRGRALVKAGAARRQLLG